MITGREKDATRIAQRLMAVHSSKPLVADGRWGTYTQSAYNSAPAEVQRAVDQILSSFGTSPSRLSAAVKAEAISNPSFKTTVAAERARISKDANEMRELVKTFAQSEGVLVDTALRICWLESRFNPDARSPTGAKGLFQFTSIATRDTLERGSPPFDLRGREFDPAANALAGMRYIKLVAKDLGVPLTDAASVYMGFNIGPTAARKYRAGNVTTDVAKLINVQAYGPPSVYGKNLASAVNNANIA